MKKKRLIIIAYLSVCVLIVIVGVNRFVNSPSDGTVMPTKQPVVPAVTAVPVEGTYADFSYPSNFDPAPDNKAVLPVLATYNFVKHETNHWSISILISQLPTGLLQDDGSYNYRSKTPARFTHAVQQFADQSAEVFTDTEASGYSKTVYLRHGVKDASITISGVTANDGNASMNARLNTIVSSWQWK